MKSDEKKIGSSGKGTVMIALQPLSSPNLFVSYGTGAKMGWEMREMDLREWERQYSIETRRLIEKEETTQGIKGIRPAVC